MDMAASAVDLDLITFSFINAKPVIAGLDGATAVIKPLEAGDEALSFETLYDTAVSGHEFERLKRHKVQFPDELKPRLYETVLVLEVGFHPHVRIRIPAKNEQAVRSKLRELMEPGQPFYQRLVEELANQIFASDDITLASQGFLTVDDPAPDGSPEWEFVPWPAEPPAAEDKT